MTPSWTTRNTLFIFLWFFAVYGLGKILLNTFENVSKPKAMKHLGRGGDIKDENVNTENDRKDENHGNATVFFPRLQEPRYPGDRNSNHLFYSFMEIVFQKLSFVTFWKKYLKLRPLAKTKILKMVEYAGYPTCTNYSSIPNIKLSLRMYFMLPMHFMS